MEVDIRGPKKILLHPCAPNFFLRRATEEHMSADSGAARDLERLRSQLLSLRAQRCAAPSSSSTQPTAKQASSSSLATNDRRSVDGQISFKEGDAVSVVDDASLVPQLKSASKLAYLGSAGTVVAYSATSGSYVIAFHDGCEVEFPANCVTGDTSSHGSNNNSNNNNKIASSNNADDGDGKKSTSAPTGITRSNTTGGDDDKENPDSRRVAAGTSATAAAAAGSSSAAAVACPFPSRPIARWRAPPPPTSVVQLAMEVGTASAARQRSQEQSELAAALAAAGLPNGSAAAASSSSTPAAPATSAAPALGRVSGFAGSAASAATAAPQQSHAKKSLVAATTSTTTTTTPAPASFISSVKSAVMPATSKAVAVAPAMKRSAAAAAAASGFHPMTGGGGGTVAVSSGGKAIRVVANGEYGASRFESDALPVNKVVVVKPIFKTMQAFRVAVARDMGWNGIGRKCAALYDAATGREVLSVDELTDGMWYIASAGNPLVPLPTSSKLLGVVLNQMKIC